MRQGQHNNNNNNNNKRSRNRGRRQPNPNSRVYESNGPDVRVRGTAAHIAEKYLSLGRDAQASGDIVQAENYFQHAEHYLRIVSAAQAYMQQSMEQSPRYAADDDDDVDGVDDLVDRPEVLRAQQPRENGSRDQQPNEWREQRGDRQPREGRGEWRDNRERQDGRQAQDRQQRDQRRDQRDNRDRPRRDMREGGPRFGQGEPVAAEAAAEARVRDGAPEAFMDSAEQPSLLNDSSPVAAADAVATEAPAVVAETAVEGDDAPARPRRQTRTRRTAASATEAAEPAEAGEAEAAAADEEKPVRRRRTTTRSRVAKPEVEFETNDN